MQKILKGVQKFQCDVFARQRELFEALAQKQQSPRALFITCSDSRINPNLITQTEPGELFILRNAGNIVPPYGSANGGEGATIEYAVSVLGLKNIIICGHWHCGAMKCLISNEDLRELPAVQNWFSHAEATRQIMRSPAYRCLSPDEMSVRAAEQNVLVQMKNLQTHPCIAAGLVRGDLQLFGWIYRIETGEIFAHDPGRNRFVSLAEERVCQSAVETWNDLTAPLASSLT